MHGQQNIKKSKEDSCHKPVLVVFEQQRILAKENVSVANKAGC